MATTTNPNPEPALPSDLSPKISAAGLTGLGILFLSTVLAAITPEMLSFLGVWAGPVQGGLVLIGAALAGYLKPDPARLVLTPRQAREYQPRHSTETTDADHGPGGNDGTSTIY